MTKNLLNHWTFLWIFRGTESVYCFFTIDIFLFFSLWVCSNCYFTIFSPNNILKCMINLYRISYWTFMDSCDHQVQGVQVYIVQVWVQVYHVALLLFFSLATHFICVAIPRPVGFVRFWIQELNHIHDLPTTLFSLFITLLLSHLRMSLWEETLLTNNAISDYIKTSVAYNIKNIYIYDIL